MIRCVLELKMNLTENGRLSYDNPNYQLHLDAVRLEDALNSNTEHFNLNSTLLSYGMDVLSPQLANMVSGREGVADRTALERISLRT